MVTGFHHAWALVFVAALAGCGGGGGGGDDSVAGTTPTSPVPTPERSGQLESAALLGTLAATDIAAALADKESLAQDVVPRFAVTSYRLE